MESQEAGKSGRGAWENELDSESKFVEQQELPSVTRQQSTFTIFPSFFVGITTALSFHRLQSTFQVFM
jgi:hypothetical protein